jgi:hypothetical protein
MDNIYNLTNKELYEYALKHKIKDPELVKRLLSYRRLRRKSNSMKLERCEQMFYLNDPETVKLLSDKNNPKLLKFLPKSMQANREVVLAFVKDAPYAIRYAHVKFFDDKEIMMIVIDKYWGMIDAVSERLMDDEEVLVRTMASERRLALERQRVYRTMPMFYTEEPEETFTYHCIEYASKRLQKKYNDYRVADDDESPLSLFRGTYEFPFPLRLNKWFYDEELTDKKYMQMRKDMDDYWKSVFE